MNKFNIFLLTIALALSACSSAAGLPGGNSNSMPLLPQAMPVDPPAGSGMLSLNTFAGDALAKMLLVRSGSGMGILTASFVEMSDFEQTSPFGRMASQQVGSRLGQHGFRVLDVRLDSLLRLDMKNGEFMLTRDSARLLSTEYDADAVLVGVYERVGAKLFISARVIRLSDSVVLGAYEYYMPMNEELAFMFAAGQNGQGAQAPQYTGEDMYKRYGLRGRSY